jgi:hypothetical protein
LVARVFAGAFSRAPNDPRRARQMTGAFLSGVLIILILAYPQRIL